MNLYEIDKEYKQIINDLYDENGEINEKAMARLQSNEVSLENKVIALASWIGNMNAEKEAIDVAMSKMAKREAILSSRIAIWRANIKNAMEERGLSEIVCPYFQLSIKKNPESVDIINQQDISNIYMKTKTSVSIDKVKIKEDLKSGKEVSGARLKRDTRLDIK